MLTGSVSGWDSQHCFGLLQSFEFYCHFLLYQEKTDYCLQGDGQYRDIPDLVFCEAVLFAHPYSNGNKNNQAAGGTKHGRFGIAQPLKHAGTGKNNALGNEIPGNDLQESGPDTDDFSFFRKGGNNGFRMKLQHQGNYEHNKGTEHDARVTDFANPVAMAGSEVLPGNGAHCKGNGHGRHEDGLHDAPANTKARLGGFAEVLDQPVDDGKITKHEQHLAARRQSDIEHSAPDSKTGFPQAWL